MAGRAEAQTGPSAHAAGSCCSAHILVACKDQAGELVRVHADLSKKNLHTGTVP